jgi:hypothetical protein
MNGLGARFWQVWLGYFRRPAFKVFSIALLLFLFSSWFMQEYYEHYYYYFPLHSRSRVPFFYFDSLFWPLLMDYLWVAFVVSLIGWIAVVASEAKRQLADYRAWIIPGYRRAQLWVVGTLLVAPYALMVAVRTWSIGSLGFAILGIGLLWTVGTITAWVAICLGWWVALLVVAIGFFGAEQGAPELIRFLFARPLEEPNRAIAIFLSDIAAMLLLGFLLAWMSGRRRGPLVDWSSWRWVTAANKWLSEKLWDTSPAGSLCDAGLWRRVSHRRRMGVGHKVTWIISAVLLAIMMLPPLVDWLTVKDLPPGPGVLLHNDRMQMYAVLVIAALVPVLAMSMIWPERSLAFSYEALRPATRAGYIREMSLAMLADMAELSLATLLPALLTVAVWARPELSHIQLWAGIGAVILAQTLAFGVVAETVQWRAKGTSVAIPTCLVVATVLLIGGGWAAQLLAAAVGIILAAHAYLRWQRADVL